MTSPHYADGPVTLYAGDCIEIMRDLPDASVDAVVTDPPYGLEFMGRDWDGADGFRRSLNAADVGRETTFGRMSAKAPEYRAGKLFQDWCELWASEALRVLKPGGHLLAFGGTRTFHRLAAGIEDAGFEIRDSLAWLYGSGFPKSLDVSKAIDRHLGNERPDRVTSPASPNLVLSQVRKVDHAGTPIAAAAAAAGLGTALKPAFEPVVVARKPLIGTVAANVLAHGTGALNIDANRSPVAAEDAMRKNAWTVRPSTIRPGTAGFVTTDQPGDVKQPNVHDGGRWPANVLLDESQAAALDEQAGQRSSGLMRAGQARQGKPAGILGEFKPDQVTSTTYGDTGGASRFFFTAKAGPNERPNVDGVAHPTVKPVELMRWLVRLVTPRGGTVLEPFAGSGTTVEACVLEGFNCIAIEREASYLPLIEKRIRKPHAVGFDFGDWDGGAA